MPVPYPAACAPQAWAAAAPVEPLSHAGRWITDAEGKVTLKFTPKKRLVKATASIEGFNPRTIRLRR